jgi:hypothetical protein
MAGVFENALLRRFRRHRYGQCEISSHRANIRYPGVAWERRQCGLERTRVFPDIAHLQSRDRENPLFWEEHR